MEDEKREEREKEENFPVRRRQDENFKFIKSCFEVNEEIF